MSSLDLSRLSSKEKRVLLERLLRENARRPQPTPLSYAQQRLWFFDQLEPSSHVYNNHMAVRLEGVVDKAVLERSLREIIRRHRPLRTVFPAIQGRPVSKLVTSASSRLSRVDLRRLPPKMRELHVQRLIKEEARRPFDLARGPLIRATLLESADDEHILLVTLHHIVSDGWSMGIFLEELARIYEAYTESRSSPLDELPIDYADFVDWQRKRLDDGRMESQLSYWRKQLHGRLPVLELPADRRRPVVQSFRGAAEKSRLSRALTEAVKDLARREGATVFMTLLAAFKVLLHRLTGVEDVVVGSPIAGRALPGTEKLIGLFVDTLALRTDLGGNPRFRDLLGKVRDVTLGAFAHQDVPFERLVEEIQPERDLSHTPLFQVFMNMLSFPGEGRYRLPGAVMEAEESFESASKFDVTLYAAERGGKLSLSLVYNADLFEPVRMSEMLRQYRRLLSQIVADPDERILRYSLLTASSRPVLPEPTRELHRGCDGSVHAQFARQVRRVPHRIAVSDGSAAWTYAELDARSNRLARFLRDQGIRSQDVVALYGDRSRLLVLAMLGSLKAGAAFVILDPSHPPLRLLNCLRVTKPRAWIEMGAGEVPAEVHDYLKHSGCPCRVDLSVCGASRLSDIPESDPGIAVDPDNLAYVTFTSGTTDVPRAVAGTHRPVTHFLNWTSRKFGFTESDRFTMLSGLAHDPLLRDIFTPLTVGATLCIPDFNLPRSSDRLVDWLKREEVSVMHLTPAMAELLDDSKPLPSLRYVFFGGDVLTRNVLSRVRRLAPGAKCVNFYGTAETPQAMSFSIPPARGGLEGAEESGGQKEEIPIGRGIDDVQLLVLNRYRQLAGVGELGEIHVRTPYLTRGYVDDEALTRERYILNPFSGRRDDKLYRTGDLGRYLPDGDVEIVCRADEQLNIRGFRIEPKEIESALARHPGVRRAAVLARENGAGDRCLVAYCVSDNGCPGAGELRAFLKDRLPNYMVPSAFVTLRELPLTPNGKLDRDALPAASPANGTAGRGKAVSSTPTAARLGKMWSELLGCGVPNPHDDFFDLGGHSLVATQLISRIRTRFHIDLPLRVVFDTPVLAEMASAIEKAIRGRETKSGSVDARPRLVPIPRKPRRIRARSKDLFVIPEVTDKRDSRKA